MQEKSTTTQSAGAEGERLAVAYLIEHGFKVLGRNYRTKFGEIDIIAGKSGVVHFIEVKARGGGSLIDPLEAVTPAKMKRVRRAAEHYLLKNPRVERMPCSFGVIGIDLTRMPPRIECVLDAFE